MLSTLILLVCSQDAQPAAADPGHEKRLAMAQALVAQMAAGDFAKAVEPFDATMQRLLPAAKLKEAWDGVGGPFGKFKQTGETRTEIAGKHQLIFVTMEFAKGRLDAKVVFDADNRIAGLFFVPAGKYRSPSYVKPAEFRDVDVQVGKGLFPLPGTLSIPNGEGPFPAIVLVHGSGPHDRDETIGPNKPFRDLAHGLASQGIAVLRYEKRTKQYGLALSLLGSGITVKLETVDDAAAAVETLSAQEKIDPKRIFVLGHSLGGMLLPRISQASDRIAGFISLAGSTRPMEDLILEQTKYILSLDGPLTEEQQEQIKQVERQVALVKSDDLSMKTPASDLPLGVPPAYWLDLRGYDPAKSALTIEQPMLSLQGERDYQVTMADFERWKTTLAARDQVKFISYPRLNHLFMEGDGKSIPTEYLTPGNVAESVIADIARWVKRQRPK